MADPLDRFRLDGKVALITGASSGLGVAFAHDFAAAGCDVALAARRADRLEAAAAKIRSSGRKAMVIPTDISDPADCQAAVDGTMAAFGHVDILINNAGVATARPATRETPEEFSQVVTVNLHGSYWMAQACGRVMKPGSSIINITSVLGLTTANLPQAAYSSSKAAIVGLTRDLAQQWAGRKGIRVNAIAPGFFLTEMTEQYEPGYLERQLNRVPLARVGNPEEVTSAAIFLASDAASYVVGVILPVDGGLLTG
jgi:NAD(P)-dependent dehydrogenase (short-subunit alcohol dehydrogenase family)